MHRRTLQSEATLRGRSLHEGLDAAVTICPAPPGTGIVFRREDLEGAPIVRADVDCVVTGDLYRRTTLAAPDGTRVQTTEHLLAALSAAGITDAEVRVSGGELPILDGSAAPFVEAICAAGFRDLAEPVFPLRITRPVAFRDADAEFAALPSEHYRITFYFTSPNPLVRSQSATHIVTSDTFAREIAPARTFGFLDEVEPLRHAGLIRGGSLANAVIFGQRHCLNGDLRFPDEPVRHKILDFIGDVALLGVPVIGHFLVWRGGHAVNAAFARFLRTEFCS